MANVAFSCNDDGSILTSIIEKNRSTSPSSGTATFTYILERWPRYENRIDFEEHLEPLLTAASREHKDLSPSELSMAKNAIAATEAMKVMSTYREEWRFNVRFSDKKISYDGKLLSLNRDFSVPEDLRTNPFFLDPTPNSSCNVLWDGGQYVSENYLDGVGAIASFKLGDAPLLRAFPLNSSNSPPEEVIREKVVSVEMINYGGRAAVSLTLGISANDDRQVVAYFDRDSSQFLANVYTEKGKESTGKYCVDYSFARMGRSKVPVKTSYTTSISSDGHAYRNIDKQTWILESLSEEEPDETWFKPKLSEDVVELVHYVESEEIYRVADPQRTAEFLQILNSVVKHGPDSQEVLSAIEIWRNRRVYPSESTVAVTVFYYVFFAAMVLTIITVGLKRYSQVHKETC